MSWWRRIFSRRRIYGELSEEIRGHLEETIEQLVAGGMSENDAKHAARRQFGNVTLVEEQGRSNWRWLSLENFFADLRFGLRMLVNHPGFTATVVLVLGLGLCCTVAIFAFVDAALIEPLPYQNPDRIAGVYESVQMFPLSNLSYQDYDDWKKLNHVFGSLDVWTGGGYLMNTPSGTKPVLAARVSDGFFRTLGVRPLMGRDFYAGEDRPEAAPTVILTYDAWRKWFAGRYDIVGQKVTLSGAAYTIVGVLPREFHFALRGKAEFWTTLRTLDSCEQRRSCHNLYGVGRLRDRVSIEQAAAEMKSIAKQLEAQYPDSNRGQGAAVVPLSDAIVGDIRPLLLVLLAGAGLLLGIACVNVANLLLVRSESRRREIAVRTALGASGPRLLIQFATEGLVLVVASCVLGLSSADWVMRLLIVLIPQDLLTSVPFLRHLGLNRHVVAFAAVLALLVGAIFSLTPAVRMSVRDVQAALVEGSRGSAGTAWRRVGSRLVVAELAIAMVLLVGAGLLGKSFYRLLHVELGFQADHLATLEVAAPEISYGRDAQQIALARLVTTRIAGLAGVQGVGITSRLPLTGNGNTNWIRILGKPFHGEHSEVNVREASAAYFTTLRAKLVRGRYFREDEDRTKAGVAIINEAFARQYFPGEDPLGQKFGDTSLSPKSLREIVGVVEDIKEGSLDSAIWPAVYEPFNQSPDGYFSIVVRTAQDEQALLPVLGATIEEIDAGIGIISEYTMSQRINESPSAYLHRSSAWLVGGFAALAMTLSIVGLYGVVAYSVSQRTREIGVRMALGAQQRSVCELVLEEAGRLAAAGIAAGLLGAVGVAVLMRGLLFGVASWDVPTLASVAATLAVFALLASYIPARRATRVDPVVALRHE